jgi:hypothetical protein
LQVENSSEFGVQSAELKPIAYTPPHLAERIRAVSLTGGERKTITALFADLKGSTVLIEGLDPEEARAIIDPALQLMMDAVHRYEGYVVATNLFLACRRGCVAVCTPSFSLYLGSPVVRREDDAYPTTLTVLAEGRWPAHPGG